MLINVFNDDFASCLLRDEVRPQKDCHVSLTPIYHHVCADAANL